MTRCITSFLLVLLSAGILSAQNSRPGFATVKGNVVTSDGKAAPYVTVEIENLKSGGITNEKGEFIIRNVKPGEWVVKISAVGTVSKEQKITAVADQSVSVSFTIQENAQQLQEVILKNHRDVKASEYVAKMPLQNLENPQVYNTVSAELMKQQIITSYDDALKNIPGIQRLWESTGRGGDGGSYFSLRGFETQVTMLNGLPGLSDGNLDPANLERIEVIKGPSGTLFGSSVVSYGGIVNNVTKKPYAGVGGEVSYTAGSFGLNRITADVNLPLNKEKGILARINTAYQRENSFQDFGFRKSFFFAPTISYKVNDKLSFLFVTEFMQEEKTNPTMLFLGRDSKLQYTDLKDLNYNPKLSLTGNDLSIKNPRSSLQAQMNYKLSNSWTSQTAVSRGQSNSDGYYSYLYDNENGNRDFGLFITKENTQNVSTDLQQNFIGDFYIGKFRNRIVAGLDYFEKSVVYAGTGWDRVHNVNAQGEINYTDPATGDPLPEVYLTRASVDQLLAGAGLSNFTAKSKVYSAYVSDVFNITPELMAMASLRIDRFDNMSYKQTALSPKFGVIYQPVKDKLSVFANYMNGFRNLGPSERFDTNGDPAGVDVFEPEHANQLEFGIKTNLFADILTSTISYYDIEVANQTMPDPQNILNTIQGGKSRSRGIEADLTARLFTGFNILVGYSHNYSNILKGELENIWFEEGKRPIWAGPKDLVNAWATYTVTGGKAKGLGVGFGGNYASDNATLNNTLTGVFILPAYTVLNGSVFYNTDKIRISFNVNNLTDKQYYGGGWSTVNPQKPRNIAANISYKF